MLNSNLSRKLQHLPNHLPTNSLPINGDTVRARVAAISSARTRLIFFHALRGAHETAVRRGKATATAAAAGERTTGTIRQTGDSRIVDDTALAFETLRFLRATHLAGRLATLIVARAGFAFWQAIAGRTATADTIRTSNASVRTAVGIVHAEVTHRSTPRSRSAPIDGVRNGANAHVRAALITVFAGVTYLSRAGLGVAHGAGPQCCTTGYPRLLGVAPTAAAIVGSSTELTLHTATGKQLTPCTLVAVAVADLTATLTSLTADLTCRGATRPGR
jgi:hypothetical protein